MRTTIASLLLLALLAGCAQSAADKQAIAAAQLAVTDARQSGAASYSAADLQEAEQQLQAARNAEERGDDVVARRLGEEAAVRARLAAARAQYARTIGVNP